MCDERGIPAAPGARLTSLYTGRIVTLDTGRVTLPNAHEIDVEVVGHPGGAAVVAVDESLRVCLLRQYRFVFDDWFWELPAGKIDPGRDTLETARRELAEEAGLEAARWRSLGESVSSPGVFRERVALYLAEDLRSVESRPEVGEMIEPCWVSLDEALSWAASGRICDAKSIVGLFRASACLNIRPSIGKGGDE